MSQTGVREQNDIPIIIGNLPKRLQKKIVDSCAAIVNADNVPETQANECQFASVEGLKDWTTECELKKSHQVLPETVLESRAGTFFEVVPGILRLHPDDVATISSSPKSHKRVEELTALSPVRHLTKAADALPIWIDNPNVVELTKELRPLHATFTDMLQRRNILNEWTKLTSTRRRLQHIFSKLLLKQLKFCCEQKVDTFFWKLLFYNVRDLLKDQFPRNRANECLLEIIDDGLQFFTDLYDQLAIKYFSTSHRYELIAKVAGQKLLICLGDLSRYKSKCILSNDYSSAERYYLRAQKLFPSNGIPYNQLAIVSIYARNKFDAVYYHMRSLLSSNSINSARESLLVLFDDIRKKFEENEKKSPLHQQHHHQYNFKNLTNLKPICKNANSSLRKEIWIHPEGARTRLHINDFYNPEDVNESSTYSKPKIFNDIEICNDQQLQRQFIAMYLYIMAKLYTGIGLETIVNQQRKLFLEFKILLQRKPLPVKRTLILKIVALNIFIIEHNKQKGNRREIRYHAFVFANKMYALVLQQCNKIMSSTNLMELSSAELEELNDLNILLQFVHMYSKWLFRNVDIWEPHRSQEKLPECACWQEVEQLFIHVSQLLKLKNGEIEVFERSRLTLEEECFFSGFTPLSDRKERASFDAVDISTTEINHFFVRLARILNFQSGYEENKHRIHMKLKCEMNFARIHSTENALKKSKSDTDLNMVIDDITKINTSIEQESQEGLQILQLSKLRRELETKSNVKRMYNEKLEEILNYVDTKFYIEIRPKYLLPDTNCFIDSIEDFEALLQEFKYYTLFIPLTVVKELDGLSKGVKMESFDKTLTKYRIHHLDDVSSRAKKSLDFIKNSKNQVKCATTKGSIINASLFALVEEEYKSNDDKILDTAIALSKSCSKQTFQDDRCFIQTELVLITTDRNLRVKALSRNLAVRDLEDFFNWTKKNRQMK